MNKTSMNYWFPKIKHLDFPMPKTEIPVTKDFWNWIKYIDGKESLSEDEKQAIRDAAIKVGGYPVFMRSDLCSGKHEFEETCFVQNDEEAISHLWQLIDINGMSDCMMESIVIREYIPPAALFKAFRGLPIAPERRYFVRGGEVVCHHAYWPEDAILFWVDTKNPKNWRAKLTQMNYESEEEITLLSKYAELIAQELGGEWSIDFMLSRDGVWYMIDMAMAQQSYHPACEKWEEK